MTRLYVIYDATTLTYQGSQYMTVTEVEVFKRQHKNVPGWSLATWGCWKRLKSEVDHDFAAAA